MDGDRQDIPGANLDPARTKLMAFKLRMAELRPAAPDRAPQSLSTSEAVPPTLRPVIDVMGATETGRQVLDSLRAEGVQIRQSDAALDAMAPAGLRLMALYDPDRKQITLRETGVDAESAASLLVHEGRHALQDAQGALDFQKEPWRLTAGGFMDAVRGAEADAHAVQAQFAYERRQSGHPEAWRFMERFNRPTVEGFDRAAARDSAQALSGEARAAAFDAFLGDAAQTRTYVQMNFRQWVASLAEAPSAQAVGSRGYDPAVLGQGGGRLLDPSDARHCFDAETDAKLTGAARQLVTLLRATAQERARLLDRDEVKQALQTFQLNRGQVEQMARPDPGRQALLARSMQREGR